MRGNFNLPVKNPESVVKEKINDLYPLRVESVDELPASGDEGIVYIKDGKPYYYTIVSTREQILYYGATPSYLTGGGPGGILYFDSSIHIGSTDEGAPDWATLPIGTKLYYSSVDYDSEESAVSDLVLYSEVLENNNGELITQHSTLTLGWIGVYQFWDFSQTQDFLEINDDVSLESFLQSSDKLGRLLYNMSQQRAINLETSVNDLKTGNKVYYGTCNTSSSTGTKVVTCSNFKLEKGATIYVTFTYGNTASYTYLNVNSTGQKTVSLDNNISNHGYKIQAGQTVCFVYDGTYFRAIRENTATTSYYGMTKLNDTLTSSSTTLAATANSVRQLNNNKENTSNKTQSITESSTTAQFPSAKAVYDFVMANRGSGDSRDITNISYFNERNVAYDLSEIGAGYENFINYYQGQPYVYLTQSIDTSSTPMYLYPLLKLGDVEGTDPYYFSLSPWTDTGSGYNPNAIGGAIYASTLTSLIGETQQEYFVLDGSGAGPAEAFVKNIVGYPEEGDMIYYFDGDSSYPNLEYMAIESYDGTTISANGGSYTATVNGTATFSVPGGDSLTTISSWTELTPVGLITESQYGYAKIGEEQYNYVNYNDPTPLLAPYELSEGTIWILDKNLDIDLSHCVADNFFTRELPSGDNIVVDTELSDTSENPVQNKVITKELNKTISSKEAEIIAYQVENNCLFVAYYNTIQDAFDGVNAVEDGDIAVFRSPNGYSRYIVLLIDIPESNPIVFTDTSYQENILDLNGYWLDFEREALEDGASWITYTGGNHFIWGKREDHNGEKTGITYSRNPRATTELESGNMLELQNSAALTIEGGAYTYASRKTKTPRLIKGTSDASLYIFNASLGVTSTTQENGATAYAISSMKRCEIENSIVEAHSTYYACGAITGITSAIINNTLVYCDCNKLSSTGNLWYTGINASNCTISNSNIEVSVETHRTYDDTIWLSNARTMGINALNLSAYNTKILVSDPRYGAGVYGILVNLGGSGIKDYYISNCHIEVDGRGDDDTADKVQNVAGIYCYDNGNTKTVNLNIEGGYYKAARDAVAGKANVYINGGVFESSQHGVYFSGNTIVARNARFINVPYTGICGWNSYPYGALYTGGEDNQKVYLDNCTIEVDPGERTHPFRHGIVNKGNEIYLSNIHFVGKFNQAPDYPSYGHLRCDTSNTIYIGKGVYYNDSKDYGGIIDTTTYANIEFNDEWLTENGVI